MDSPIWLPLAIILGFAIVFPLFWSGIVALIGLLSGWTRLGRQYRTPSPVGGKTVAGMRMGWSNYNNVARVDGTMDGLGLDVFVLFRPGHPPLRIPWSQVNFAGRRSVLFWKYVLLDLGPDRTRLMLPEAAWAGIADDARRGGVREG